MGIQKRNSADSQQIVQIQVQVQRIFEDSIDAIRVIV